MDKKMFILTKVMHKNQTVTMATAVAASILLLLLLQAEIKSLS